MDRWYLRSKTTKGHISWNPTRMPRSRISGKRGNVERHDRPERLLIFSAAEQVVVELCSVDGGRLGGAGERKATVRNYQAPRAQSFYRTPRLFLSTIVTQYWRLRAWCNARTYPATAAPLEQRLQDQSPRQRSKGCRGHAAAGMQTDDSADAARVRAAVTWIGLLGDWIDVKAFLRVV
jgi:hypothetical protein